MAPSQKIRRLGAPIACFLGAAFFVFVLAPREGNQVHSQIELNSPFVLVPFAVLTTLGIAFTIRFLHENRTSKKRPSR